MLCRYKTRWDNLSNAYQFLVTACADTLIEDRWNSETQEWISSGIEIQERGRYKMTENQYAFEKQQEEKIEENWKRKEEATAKNEVLIRNQMKRIQGLAVYRIVWMVIGNRNIMQFWWKNLRSHTGNDPTLTPS